MARGRNSHHGAGGGALLACDRAISKSDEQKQSLRKLQARVTQCAEVIHLKSDVATLLKESGDDGAEDFLTGGYSRLRALGEGNAKRMYEIEYFVDAVKEVRTEVEQKNNAAAASAAGAGGEGASANADAPNYERSMQDALERARQNGENDPNRVPTDEHEMTNEVRDSLGEKIKKRARASKGGGGDSDDELEVVRNRVDDENALKCPITGMLFNHPVKNKICHHVYDRAGLDQMIRTGKKTCPVPGCANKSVTLAQVEEDEQMKLKVQRHKKREEAQKRKKELEEDDEDEEGDGGGYTVLE